MKIAGTEWVVHVLEEGRCDAGASPTLVVLRGPAPGLARPWLPAGSRVDPPPVPRESGRRVGTEKPPDRGRARTEGVSLLERVRVQGWERPQDLLRGRRRTLECRIEDVLGCGDLRGGGSQDGV